MSNFFPLSQLFIKIVRAKLSGPPETQIPIVALFSKTIESSLNDLENSEFVI